jgi:hypothetical protein
VVEGRQDDLQSPVAVEVGDRGSGRDADAVAVVALVLETDVIQLLPGGRELDQTARSRRRAVGFYLVVLSSVVF